MPKMEIFERQTGSVAVDCVKFLDVLELANNDRRV